MKLREKVAIVTGGSQGIGRGIAMGLAEAGADVVVNCDRNIQRAEEVANEIRTCGRRAIVAQADVSKSTDVKRMVQLTLEKFGKIDILVNNAGIEIGGAIEDVSEEVWDRVMGINLGRGDARGEAIVQTFYPDHYTIRHACRQDYAAFFEDEIRYRHAMRYPPVVAMINLVVRARSAGAAMTAAETLARDLRTRSASFRVLGPAPAPLIRLRGEHRAQVFLKGRNRRAMREAVTAALEAAPDLRRHVTVDVDPLTVL